MKRRIDRVRRHYQQLVREHGGRLKEVADLAGVSVAAISRIVSGKTSPRLQNIQDLAVELGKVNGAHLMADFFRDLIPKGLKRQIKIRVLSNNTRCLSTEYLPASLELLPGKGQRMIERLIQLCLEDPEMLQHYIDEVDLIYDPGERPAS
jgi:transcriptional regulator with XRE-family HTH domain